MQRVFKLLSLLLFMLPMTFLTGCAVNNTSEEALQRADRALEQAELCNQRVDRLMEGYGSK